MGKMLTHLKFRASYTLLFSGGLLASLLLPAALNAQMTVTVTGTNITCFGDNDGAATANATGGLPPYTYQWSNGATTTTVTGLAPGTYSVTATAANAGTAVGMITITQPLPLNIIVSCESQICGLAPDGSAQVVPANGTPPYTYLWSNGATTPQITGLPAGTYTATVTDAHGCTLASSCTVFFWNEGIWLMGDTVDVSCFGQGDGFAHISAMSGTPPYTYLWNTGATVPDIFNLVPDVYTVTVTDANGCTNFINFPITEPPQLSCEVSSIPGACGQSGSATVNPSGGTPPYSVLWSTNSTNLTITAPPGTYSVTVTDANDCTCSSTVTIGSTSSSIVVNTTVNSSAGCTVGGSATATASGGTGNYAYVWDNGQNAATATNLTVGVHKVTVTDITTGCTATATADIPAAPTLTAVASLLTNATCLTGGSASASGNGGTLPYSFLWDNNQTTPTATNLIAGPHSVTITDSKGCVATATVTIGQNQGPTVTTQVISNATCTAGGSARADASGGTAPYNYLWDNAQTTAIATNLSVGPHSVTVTDAGGCSATASVTITQPGAPTLVVTNKTNAGCTTGGSATVAASNGTPPYTYNWSNMTTGPTISNLLPGNYTATVTDAGGCTATVSVNIAGSVPPSVVISASSNAKCDQPGSATASVSGGTDPISYKWDNNETTATATNLAVGPHSVTVTDAAGCTATASVTIGFTNNGIKTGDFVWYDENQNGFQDPSEGGVGGVSVALQKAGPDGVFDTPDDQTLNTTTTNASGNYQFECVTPGTYVLKFSGIPGGYQYTKKDFVGDDCKDSDVKSNGKTSPFTIVVGQTDSPCFDAGIHVLCQNVQNAGIVCCDQTICEGETPALLYNVQSPFGGSGAIEYQWLQLVQIGQAPPNWVAIPGAVNATYQPGALFETSYFMRCARRAGCTSFLESNIVTIMVQPAGSSNCPDFTNDLSTSLVGNNTVLVQWTTALPELDKYIYTVQHSVNMTEWAGIATVLGWNDATKPNHYSVVHQTPVSGMNHYRVKRVNETGVTTYSLIKSLDLAVTLESSITINPNPASDYLIIKNVAEYDADVPVQLINTNGDVLHTLIIKKGTLHFEQLPVTDLPAGLYMVRVRFPNGNMRTIKVTKF